MPSPKSRIELHLYCHGLGDCHLLRLPSKDGDQWILIDCGIHTSMSGGADRIRTVVEDVLDKTNGKLRAIVGTHEHWDHNSAFHPAQGLFTDCTVAEVWFAWTENDGNDEAKRLDKYKGEATRTLQIAQRKLQQAQDDLQNRGSAQLHEAQGLAELNSSLGGVLGFLGFDSPSSGPMSANAALAGAFGLEGDRVRAARENLKSLGTPKYLEPGDVIELSDQIRCYVLAPAHDTNFSHLDDKDLTYSAAAAAPLLTALQNALAAKELEDDPTSPFDGDEGEPLDKARGDPFLRTHYDNEPWRRIDNDWLMPTTELALQLDKRTNNTSLVLAFEIIASRHVLIFAADAQIGNWQTWHTVVFPANGARPRVTGKDLLERAVFYKVGHHGSRNATMSTGGLELMTSLEIAFNPTDRDMAKKVKWEDIPAKNLNEKLKRSTSGRLIQSDQLDTLDLTKFVAGGALGSNVEIQVAKGHAGRPSIECVICSIV